MGVGLPSYIYERRPTSGDGVWVEPEPEPEPGGALRRRRSSTEHSRAQDTDTREIRTWDFGSWIPMGEDPLEPHAYAKLSNTWQRTISIHNR
jgi:hypothetical protein